MADRRRLVTKSEITGTVTTLRDFENAATLQSVRGSWVVTPGQRKPMFAASQRRYGGARQTGETHDNASIGWKVLVAAATADLCIAALETALGDLESMAATVQDVYVEWRPDGATNSVYYEVRGPATWQPEYDWAQFSGARSMEVDIKIPVAPLAELAAYDIAFGPVTMPGYVTLSAPITGSAPARASVSLTTSGGTAAPIWAMLGWAKRPTAPLAASLVPFGFLEAEWGTSLSGWADVANAIYHIGHGLEITTAGAGTASALYAIDPSVMQPDDFTPGEMQMEVWARMLLQSTLVSPRVTLSVEPFAGTNFGAVQYAAEFGSAGHLLTLPTGANRPRFVKLGTINLPVDPLQPLKHNLKVAASWAAGSSGAFGMDYLALVCARQRALGPTGKPNDASYPKFIASTGATTKTIRSDLSGRVASGAGNPGRDAGLGGQLLELPVGNVDLFVKLSSLVPDDPTVDGTSEQLEHTGVTGSVRVTPRVWLAA